MYLPTRLTLGGYPWSLQTWKVPTAAWLCGLLCACETQRFASGEDEAPTSDATNTQGSVDPSPSQGAGIAMDGSPSYGLAPDASVHDDAISHGAEAGTPSALDAAPSLGEGGDTAEHLLTTGSASDSGLAGQAPPSGGDTQNGSDAGDASATESDPSTPTSGADTWAQPTDVGDASDERTEGIGTGETTSQGETSDNWLTTIDNMGLDAGEDASSLDAATLHEDAALDDASSAEASTPADASALSQDGGRNYQDAGIQSPRTCTPTVILPGTIRDFSDTHPDMDPCGREGVDCSSERGLLEVFLGDDGKPVLADTSPREGSTIFSRESYAQWYRDVEDVNISVGFNLELRKRTTRLVYDSDNPPDSSPAGFFAEPPGFFPIDDLGVGEYAHNYHFTYEVASHVQYMGGESFRIRGDDDIWVFINRRLVVDLGGIHLPEEATVDLDDMAEQLGIEPGHVYEFHLFFAERHTEQSNLRFSTTMLFMDCSKGLLQ